jgi:hypothetical protein
MSQDTQHPIVPAAYLAPPTFPNETQVLNAVGMVESYGHREAIAMALRDVRHATANLAAADEAAAPFYGQWGDRAVRLRVEAAEIRGAREYLVGRFVAVALIVAGMVEG